MENASKALIIAGGMLIGILIASLFAYEMVALGKTQESYHKRLKDDEINTFNEQFQKYENTLLTAQDVVTIYNYIQEWNLNNPNITIDTTSSIELNKVKNGSKKIEDFLNDSLVEYGDMTKTLITKYNIRIPADALDENGRIVKIKIVDKKVHRN